MQSRPGVSLWASLFGRFGSRLGASDAPADAAPLGHSWSKGRKGGGINKELAEQKRARPTSCWSWPATSSPTGAWRRQLGCCPVGELCFQHFSSATGKCQRKNNRFFSPSRVRPAFWAPNAIEFFTAHNKLAPTLDSLTDRQTNGQTGWQVGDKFLALLLVWAAICFLAALRSPFGGQKLGGLELALLPSHIRARPLQ